MSRKAGEEEPSGEKNPSENAGNESGPGVAAGSPVSEQSEALTEEDSPYHNNNKDGTDTKERPRYRLRRGDGECSPWLPPCAETKRKRMC